MQIDIPGFGRLHPQHLLLDFNGTLAIDGHVLSPLESLLKELGQTLTLHVLTADTFGSVREELAAMECIIRRLSPAEQDQGKRDYLRSLRPDQVIAIGNGRNDVMMLNEADLGIAVIQQEGAASGALMAADVVCRSTEEALQLLLSSKRLTATLRC